MTAHPSQVSASWRRSARRITHLGVVLLVAGTLFLTANTSLSAQPVKTSLPTLWPDYGGITPNGKVGIPLDPAVQQGITPVIQLVNASLVKLLPSGKFGPDLATWKVSANGLLYTFTFRKGARFSNGHTVTAQDGAYSFQRLLMPSTKLDPGTVNTIFGLIQGAIAYANGTAKTLTGVKVVNARTLQITITRPAAYFLGILWDYSFVFDRAVVAGKPIGRCCSPRDFKTNYLTNTCTGNQGAGPFTFVCHDGSSTLHSFYSGSTPKYTLVPNRYYYGQKAHIRQELMRRGGGAIVNNYRAYLAGTLDTTDIPAPYLNRWRGKSSQYRELPTSAVFFLTPNVHLAPFDNVHCRLAMAYAINRDTLYNKVLGGTERPTYAIVPKGMLGYYPGKNNPHYNLSKARSELAKCPDRTSPVELTYSTDLSRNETAFILRNLLDAGFNIKLKPLSPNDWSAILNQPLDKSKTQLVFNGWVADYFDPQDYCSLLLRSGNPSNTGGWHNAGYDRLVDKADAAVAPETRAKLYIQAQHIALSQGAFISLSYQVAPRLIKPYVHGLTVNGFGGSVDWSKVSISPHAHAALASKKHCTIVTKKVHGKKVKLRKC